MLLPRLLGLSLLKILCHEHLLYHLIFVLVIGILHYIDDVIGGIFDLCRSRGRILHFVNLGSIRPGTVLRNVSRTIAA